MLETLFGVFILIGFAVCLSGAYLIVQDREEAYWAEKEAHELYEKMQENINEENLDDMETRSRIV